MDMTITFPGGAKVNAEFGGLTVKTDQPIMGGGEGSAPTPYATFLSSVGTCAGIYILGFLQNRGIDPSMVKLVQRNIFDPATRRLSDIRLEIETAPGFPQKYHDALVRTASQCAVKKTFENPPAIHVNVLNEEEGYEATA